MRDARRSGISTDEPRWGPMNRFGMRETRNLEAVFLGAPERLVEIVAAGNYTCARSETGHVFCGGWY